MQTAIKTPLLSVLIRRSNATQILAILRGNIGLILLVVMAIRSIR